MYDFYTSHMPVSEFGPVTDTISYKPDNSDSNIQDGNKGSRQGDSRVCVEGSEGGQDEELLREEGCCGCLEESGRTPLCFTASKIDLLVFVLAG